MNLAMCDIQPFLLQASSGSSSIAADSSASAAGTDSDSEAARLFGDEEDIFEPLASGGAAGCHVVAEGGVDAEGGAGSCPLLAASSGDMPPQHLHLQPRLGQPLLWQRGRRQPAAKRVTEMLPKRSSTTRMAR